MTDQEQVEDSEGMSRSEVSRRYWDSPKGLRQRKRNAENTRKSVNKYYKRHGGTHSDEVKAKISQRTREGIARAEADPNRKPKKRAAPKDGLWESRVAQVMEEFDLAGMVAADLMARELLKEDKVQFYSKYRGLIPELHKKITRSLLRYTDDEMLVEIILDGLNPDFDLPQIMIDRISETALTSGSRYEEEVFFHECDLEIALWHQERKDFDAIIAG